MAKAGSTNLSDLVKEMVKEMDANDFYARGDIYDESSEEPWYTIEISLEDHSGEGRGSAPPRASLRKPWSEFQRLHYLLLTDEFGCDEAIKAQFPMLPVGPEAQPGCNDDGSSTGDGEGERKGADARGDTASDLTVYLNALLAIPAVVQSQVFSGFLDEKSCRAAAEGDDGSVESEKRGSSSSDGAGGGSGGDGPQEPETAIDFLLQPFDYTSAYVPRREDHTEQIDVLRGESVVWKFEVLDHLDINFSVVFRPHPVVMPSHNLDFGDNLITNEADANFNGDFAAEDWKEVVGAPSSPGPKGGSSSCLPVETSVTTKEEAATGTNCRPRGSGWWGAVGVSKSASARTEKSVYRDAGGSTEEGPRDCEKKRDEASQEKTVHLPTRYSTGGGDPVQGSFTCPEHGTCILRWDNSYSRLRGKRLCFVMESVTVQTMRAAIEAAGAADHKRRAKRTRSAAAQTILDSGFGQAKVTVTAVGVGGDGCSLNGEDGDTDAAKGNGSAAGNPDGSYDSGGYYRFGRVRRVAAALLRDLGTVVDARQYGVASSGSYIPGMSNSEGGNGDDGADGNVTCSGGGGGGGGARMRDRLSGYVDADGVNKLVERFELLEDEVASASARRAQSEAQAKVLLATLQKANTRADRLERTLEDTQGLLGETQLSLEETEASRDEEAEQGAAAAARLQAAEEQLLRTKRERDLLQAERSVWHVARSGIQEELAKVVAELELERHRHDDASQALAKSHEARAHAETEAARLTRRLEEERGGVGGIRAALAAEREAARLAREEAEDARTAVAELDAAVAELGAQKRVLVAGLRARERALGDRCAAAEARVEESGMMRRAAESRVKELEEDAERREAAQADAEVRLQRLRAEKKVLLAEIRRGVGSGGVRGGGGGAAAGGAGDDTSSVGSGGGGGRDKDSVQGNGADEVDGVLEAVSPPPPPLPTLDVTQDKATLKQLSRQLVHLRERQYHLREDLKSNPSNASTQRLDADVNRAVRNLEIRIRRLLAVVAGGGRDEGERSVTSSAGSLSPLSPAVEGGAGTGKGRRKAVGGIEGSIRQRGPSRAVPPPPPSPPPPPLESETESYSV